MKASLFLLVCLVGLSVQQNLFWPFPPQARFQYLNEFLNRRSNYPGQHDMAEPQRYQERDGKVDVHTNYFFNDQSPRNRFKSFFNPLAYDSAFRPSDYGSYAETPGSEDSDVEERINGPLDVESRLANKFSPAARFFIPIPFPYNARLKTSYVFVSTSIVVTTTRYCTEAIAFNTTNSCRRRRDALFDMLDESPENRPPIEPSGVEQVEATHLPRLVEQPEPVDTDPVKLAGSIEPELEPLSRRARTYGFITTVTIITLASTPTTTTVVQTIRSSALLLNGSKIQCVPAGATVC